MTLAHFPPIGPIFHVGKKSSREKKCVFPNSNSSWFVLIRSHSSSSFLTCTQRTKGKPSIFGTFLHPSHVCKIFRETFYFDVLFALVYRRFCKICRSINNSAHSTKLLTLLNDIRGEVQKLTGFQLFAQVIGTKKGISSIF